MCPRERLNWERELDSLSLDQQTRGYSGSLYDPYKDTNYIYAYCE